MGKEAVEAARQLDGYGFNVIPAKPRGKSPVIDWKPFQQQRTGPKLATWFGVARQYNFWVATGRISRAVVIDVDSREGDVWWREKLGAELLDTTCCVRSAKGYHYWFSIPEDELELEWPSWAVHEDGGVSFDVRGDGTGVIVPPSIHESGHVYEWIRGPEAMQPAPEALRVPTGISGGLEDGARAVRSMLAELLGRPPATEGSGRNSWMAQVAGHLARWVPHQDAFDALVETVNRALPEPLPATETSKLRQSIWTRERTKETRGEPTEGNGWLAGDGNRIYTPVKTESNGLILLPWSDFDMRALGVVRDDGGTAYQVEIRRPDHDPILDLLPAHVLGNPPRLTEWLTKHEAVVLPPSGEAHRGAVHARLQRYLKAQEPPTYRGVASLGWHDGLGFVCHEGVIDGEGMRPHEGIVPASHLRERAPYRYGMRSAEEAREVLAQVLTFHDEMIAAVFGAWWTACILKAQIMKHTRQFPFMALEAPSESGKTSGYFSLMVRLSGNTQGHGEATTAALRDQVAAHRNGIVWVDDMDDVTRVLDLLRQATGEGTRTKKSQDRFSQETVRLVAPIMLSGEGLGAINREKALVDRAVLLTVPSPTGRMSLIDPERPQWDDILDLEARYPDLSEFAGRLVQMALSQAPRVAEFRKLRPGSGRYSDKIATLRVGARVLAEMVQDAALIERVDEWCEASEDIGQENMLTREVLPRLLIDSGMPTTARHAQPVWIDQDGTVWFNEPLVAARWGQIKPDDRLGSVESLRAQRKALGVDGQGQRFSTLDGRSRGQTDRLVRYHPLPLDVSERVVERTHQSVSSTGSKGRQQGGSTGKLFQDIDQETGQ